MVMPGQAGQAECMHHFLLAKHTSHLTRITALCPCVSQHVADNFMPVVLDWALLHPVYLSAPLSVPFSACSFNICAKNGPQFSLTLSIFNWSVFKLEESFVTVRDSKEYSKA